MHKKNIIGFLLALVILFSLGADSFAVYAEEVGQKPRVENKIPGASEEVDKEKSEDPQKEEELVQERLEPEKKADKLGEAEENQKVEELVSEGKEAKDLKAKGLEDAIELGEEKVPGPVGEPAPADFDLKSIHTIAKTLENGQVEYYGVRTYSNTIDMTEKVFYSLTEDQYNQVAKDCFMVFKRQDGEAFKIPYAEIGNNSIADARPSGTEAGPIFTEIQFRHHMAYYALLYSSNNNPTMESSQEDLTWSIELKKDWVIEPRSDFSDNSESRFAYVYYNVEIDGQGHKIYRNDDREKGILQLGSGMYGQNVPVRTATIKNLTIEGDNKYYGIEVSQKGILNLENVRIENCYAGKNHYYYGGAIKLNNEAQLTMDAKTSISNCKANLGGAIRLLDNCSLTINGSRFTNNQADLGGAICTTKNDCTINITGATFDGNKTTKTIDGKYLYGGAIYSQSNLNVEDSKFTNNSADGNGGAIYSYKAYTIKDSEFSKNNSKKSGGAIYAPEDAPATILNTKFEENEAAWGGAIFDKGNSSIKNANFNKNHAQYYGGAIYTNNGTTIEDSHFIENKTLQGGGIYINKNAQNLTKVSNTSFEKNSVVHGGAGIFVDKNSKLEVTNSTFAKNNAARGAGISSAATGNVNTNLSNIKVDSSTFTDNLSLMGAGIFTAFPTEINNCTFTKNKADIHPQDDKKNPHDSGVGGAVEVMDNKTTIKASTFKENWAHGSGGAIGINGVNRDNNGKIISIKPNIKVEISKGTKFIGNTCGVGQGGAILTIPYLYDIEGYETGVPEDTLKEKAYQNLTTAADTVFKDNVALSGFVDPPANYANYTNLAFKSNSFTDVLPGKDVAKSLLNNYDVNYKNKKLSAFFDPNGGEFTDANNPNPKAIKVIRDDEGKEIEIIAAPKRDGYKFLGWKCSMNIPDDIFKKLQKGLTEEDRKKLNEGKIYQAGDKFKLDADYIFLAQWEKEEAKPEPKPEPKPEVEPRRHEHVEKLPVIARVPDKESHIHWRYLFGYPDKTVRPEGNMTRAEALAVVTRLEGYSFKDDSEKLFKDMKKNAWYNKYINAAFEHGILVEKAGEAFRPDEQITRAEFAKLISFIDKKNSKLAPFADVKGHKYEDAINQAYGNDRIKGYPDGTFRPDAKITRAEIVTILNNFYDRKADDKSLEGVKNKELLKVFRDLDKKHWAYYEITEAANSHAHVRRTSGIVENWLRLLEDLKIK